MLGATAVSAEVSKVWVPDLGNGMYKNPVIFADYSDPDAVRGPEGDYWMTASSFACTPGLPILHSTDLVNWEIVNYALPAVPPYDFYNATAKACGRRAYAGTTACTISTGATRTSAYS